MLERHRIESPPQVSDSPAPAADQTTSSLRKLMIELGPLVVFFLANWQLGIFWATGLFMVCIAAAMIYSWMSARHIPPMLWVTGVVVMVFGGLTIYLHDDLFIKLKPTIVNSIFAVVLFAGLAMKRPLLKPLVGAAFPPLTDRGWTLLTTAWAAFFVFLAVLNEVVWRNSSTDFWVGFKLWGVMPITLLFSGATIPLILKHQLPEARPVSPATDR